MSRSEPTSAELRRTGLLTLIGIVVFATLVVQLPNLFSPSYTDYMVRIELEEGADGLDAGNTVLVAGLPHGVITRVAPIPNPETGIPDAIEVGFELETSIPIAPDAVITRVAGLGNDGASLSIGSLGTPGRPFPSPKQRILRLATSTSERGMVSVLGRYNAEAITRIGDNLDAIERRIPARAKATMMQFDALRAAIGELLLDLEPQRLFVEQSLRNLGPRIKTIEKHWAEIGPKLAMLQADFAKDRTEFERHLAGWRRDWERMESDLGRIRGGVDVVMAEVEKIRPRMTGLIRNFDTAISDGRALMVTLQTVGPEFGSGIQRTLARMVLAGGQLRLATQNLLPLAIEAITTSPDARSEARQMLLEAVGDAVLAGITLEDAMRRTHMLTRVYGDGDLPVAEMVEPLDRVVSELDRLLESIYRRLRLEIDEDLADR